MPHPRLAYLFKAIVLIRNITIKIIRVMNMEIMYHEREETETSYFVFFIGYWGNLSNALYTPVSPACTLPITTLIKYRYRTRER